MTRFAATGDPPAAAAGPAASADGAEEHALDRYGFLACAIAGRQVAIRWATQSESLAYSDGRSIFVPPLESEAVEDVWVTIAAQAALMGAGSLHPSMLAALVGRPAVARRYLYLEMLRAAHLLEYWLPRAFTERPELRVPPLSGSARESFEVAATQRELPRSPAYFGRIVPLLALRTALSEGGWAALSRKQQEGRIKTAQVAELDEDDPGESSTLLRLFQNPFSGSPVSDVLNRILGAGISKQRREARTDAGDGGAELPVGRVERALRRGIYAVRSTLAVALPNLERVASPAFVYPEWDVHASAYRRDWVFVEESDAWREDGPQDVASLLGTAPMELRRQLAGLGVDQKMHRRQHDGSDLDLSALIECAIELRAGHSSPALNVYRASRRTRRDLAVTLVLDISGSTGEQLSEGHSIFGKQLQAVYQLGQVFDSLGDTVAIFGFHSWGRKLARVVRIKGHDERWSLRVAERMALLEPVGYTRIGAAIRHGSRLLHDTMRLPNRLLILITDGIAYDQDYELGYAAGMQDVRSPTRGRPARPACV